MKIEISGKYMVLGRLVQVVNITEMYVMYRDTAGKRYSCLKGIFEKRIQTGEKDEAL